MQKFIIYGKQVSSNMVFLLNSTGTGIFLTEGMTGVEEESWGCWHDALVLNGALTQWILPTC